MMGKMPMVFSGPKTEPRTVVKRLKNDPQPMPLTMEKKIKRPKFVAKGQMAKALMPQRKSEMIKVLRAPRRESAT